MAVQYILSDYVREAMAQAVYDKLEDGTFAGRIPSCKGVVAFGDTLRSLAESYKQGEVRQNGAAAVEARPNGRF